MSTLPIPTRSLGITYVLIISLSICSNITISVNCKLIFISFCRRFFLAACDVPSLEDRFNVDKYSDLITVSKPVIYISIGEIINTHTVCILNTSTIIIDHIDPQSHTHYSFLTLSSSCWITRTPLLPSTTISFMSCWRI